MSDDSERKWIHPAVFGVLEASDEMRDCLDKRKGEEASIVVLLNKISKWKADNRPLLTPRARAVLAAVERAMPKCDECYNEVSKNRTVPTYCILNCKWYPLRKAWEEKP